MATIGGSNAVKSGLVLSLDAANARSYVSGSAIWNDLSGTNNHTQGTLIYQRINNIDTLYFSGTQFASSANALTTVNGGVTLEGFTYLISNSSPQGLVGYRSGGDIFVIGVNGSPKPFIQTMGSQFTGNSTLSFNSWWHLVAVNSGSSTLIYVNGILDSSFSTSAVPTIASGATVGRWVGGNQGSIGNIANVKVYNRPLSATEVAQNFNAQKSRFNL
jgi:hypothetical protein